MKEININKKEAVNDINAVVISTEKETEQVIRSSIIIINTSSGGQIITIAIDKEAVANQGIVLNAGGSWQDSRDGNYFPTQKMITAISSAAGGMLSIQERLIA